MSRRRILTKANASLLIVAGGMSVCLMTITGAIEERNYIFLAVVFISLIAFLLFIWFGVKTYRSKQKQYYRNRIDLFQLISLTPNDFELRMVQLYRDMGYQVIHTGKPSDHGIDLVVTDKLKRKWIVQCKKYAPDRNVSEPEVRDLVGALVKSNAIGGVLITTSGFSRHAIEWARHNPAIRLYDGKRLVDVIQKVGNHAPIN